MQRLPSFTTIAWGSLIFLYAPIAVLILFSFNAGKMITVWQGFSVSWYGAALANPDLTRAGLHSLIVAMGAAILSTLIALPAALARRKGRATTALILLPMLAPEVVIAVATAVFFAAVGINLGLGNVLIAHVVFCVPFAYLPLRARVKTLPSQLIDAAADLYACPRKIFFSVTLPLLMPGIVSGALLAFITSLDDFMITQMVAPPGAMTLPVYIYSMVRRGITPEINAASSLLLVISMVFVIGSYFLNRRKPV